MSEAIAGLVGFFVGVVVAVWAMDRTLNRVLDEAIAALREANRIMTKIKEVRAMTGQPSAES